MASCHLLATALAAWAGFCMWLGSLQVLFDATQPTLQQASGCCASHVLAGVREMISFAHLLCIPWEPPVPRTAATQCLPWGCSLLAVEWEGVEVSKLHMQAH